MKDWKTEDKVKNDSELWSIWLNKYLNRIYEEINNSTDSEIINKRIDLMNANNPRFYLIESILNEILKLFYFQICIKKSFGSGCD